MYLRSIIHSVLLFGLAGIFSSANMHWKTSADARTNALKIHYLDKVIEVKLNAPGIHIEKTDKGLLRFIAFHKMDRFYQVYFYPELRFNKEQPSLIKQYKLMNREPILDGSTYAFNEEGQLVSETQWKEGQLHGTQTMYNPLGQVIEEKTYYQGYPVGEWKMYYSSGSVATVTTFPEGMELWKATVPKSSEHDTEEHGDNLATRPVHTTDIATEVWYREDGVKEREVRYKVFHDGKSIVMEKISEE